MGDVTGAEYRRIREVADGLWAYLSGMRYEGIDTPVLEETELFVRKAGGELTSRLYSFVDPAGTRVSLRPEFTPSVIRHFIQEGQSLPLPVRWQYGGPVFRYGPGDNSAFCQYTQLGAEQIGKRGHEADADVLAMALEGVLKAGLRDCRIRIGHIGVLRELLAGYGLSEPAKLLIIGNVRALKNGETDAATLTRQATDTGLLRTGMESIAGEDIAQIDSRDGREFIQGVLAGAMSSPVGRRTPDEIVERLLRKVRRADDPSRFEDALALVSELAQVEDIPTAALQNAIGIAARHGAETSPIEDLGQLFAALGARGVEESQMVLDLGLARGISYYTGVIFDIYPDSPGGSSLGGGGRYDGLVKALGGPDVPALGFAYTLEHVVAALAQEDARDITGAEDKRATPSRT